MNIFFQIGRMKSCKLIYDYPICSISLKNAKEKKKQISTFFSHVCLCVYIVNDISVVDSMDSTAQTGQTSGGDWQEEVYQKVICYYLILISWVNWVEQQKIFKQMAFVLRIIL
jgi:hypothetical protein